MGTLAHRTSIVPCDPISGLCTHMVPHRRAACTSAMSHNVRRLDGWTYMPENSNIQDAFDFAITSHAAVAFAAIQLKWDLALSVFYVVVLSLAHLCLYMSTKGFCNKVLQWHNMHLNQVHFYVVILNAISAVIVRMVGMFDAAKDDCLDGWAYLSEHSNIPDVFGLAFRIFVTIRQKWDLLQWVFYGAIALSLASFRLYKSMKGFYEETNKVVLWYNDEAIRIFDVNAFNNTF